MLVRILRVQGILRHSTCSHPSAIGRNSESKTVESFGFNVQQEDIKSHTLRSRILTIALNSQILLPKISQQLSKSGKQFLGHMLALKLMPKMLLICAGDLIKELCRTSSSAIMSFS